jgi:hypothetical protein
MKFCEKNVLCKKVAKITRFDGICKKLKTLRSAETTGFDILDARKYISKENIGSIL